MVIFKRNGFYRKGVGFMLIGSFEELKPQGSLKYYIHTLKTKDSGHEIGVLHASDLTNQETEFCPRERVYLIRAKNIVFKTRHLDTCLAYTFALGYAIESLIVNWAKDIAWGKWQCAQCGNESVGLRPAKCVKCDSTKAMVYRGLVVHCKDLNLSGSIDLLIKLPGEQKVKLTELKSIDKDYFTTLVAPYAEHTVRTQLYMELVRRCSELPEYKHLKQVDTDEGLVFYAMKGYGKSDKDLSKWPGVTDKMSPFKEFRIKKGDMSLQFAKARAVVIAMETNDIPERLCGSKLEPRAINCMFVEKCFDSGS